MKRLMSGYRANPIPTNQLPIVLDHCLSAPVQIHLHTCLSNKKACSMASTVLCVAVVAYLQMSWSRLVTFGEMGQGVIKGCLFSLSRESLGKMALCQNC